jgi:translation initiation factor IF-1
MPGVTARSAAKNMSKTARAKEAKNARRVEAACNDELEGCTYGRITKTLGNKMFNVLDVTKREHLGHIRGKMARIGVYDIMAVFQSKKDIHRLIKAKLIPTWLASAKGDNVEGDDEDFLFDYEESESESDDEDDHAKKDKKSHRKAGKNAIDNASDSDGPINIDDI